MDNQWTFLGIVAVQLGTLAGMGITVWNTRRAAKQLQPNGGASVADAVHRIDKRLDRISDDVGAIRADHDALQERFDNHIDGREPRRRQRKDTAA